jgi:2-polyprenyl-3-methyl-5-hydroxy-6-metoxy-1,4-benzoquinol methylase
MINNTSEHLDACPLCNRPGLVIIDRNINLCRCNGCGLVLDNPRPTIEALQAYYSGEDKYDHWIANEALRDRLWSRRLAKILRRRSGGSLLDVGAGTGQFLAHAKKHFHPVAGTELSASACAIAREKYGFALLAGSIEDIDFKDQRYSMITLFHVLEHVPYPLRFLRRCRDLLPPGGMLVIAVPNELFSLRRYLKTVVKRALKAAGVARFRIYGAYGFSRIEFGEFHDEVHLSHFTSPTLCRTLEKEGFTVTEASLDPYYVASFPRSLFESIYYLILLLVHRLSGVNVYDTIWITAEKRG